MSNVEVIVVQDNVRAATMRAFAAEHGWRRTGQTDRAHLVMASEQWTPESDLTVTWVQDHTCGTKMVRIQGRLSPVLVVADRLREALPNRSRVELIEQTLTSESAEELIGLAGKLSHCRPEHLDPKQLEAVQVVLRHPAVAVRRAAIRCCYRYPWPQLLPIIVERYAADPVLGAQLRRLQRYLESSPAAQA